MRDIVNNQGGPTQLGKIVATATILALLYYGRDVLIPITLAIGLSFLIAPFVRGLRRIGLGPTLSVGVSVLVLTLGLSAIGVVIGAQIIRLGTSLPQYEETIRGKLQVLDQITLGKLSGITGLADRAISQLSGDAGSAAGAAAASRPDLRDAGTPVPVELHEPAPKPIQLLRHFVESALGPLAMTGAVFFVLIFVLHEHEALRDRFIRLIGTRNIRATTDALNDAGERLSRFFVSQVAVNILVGVLIWSGLSIFGLPQPLLWGASAGILRFVPYIGIWIAAFCATLLAAAITPGWSLAIITLTLFISIEMIVSQLVEPRLYGHTAGLSPLSVVIAAIFWSWIWGPVGLVLSTPLTLCLVVAGRYINALAFLDILFGDAPALSRPENFYQRALAGDAQEIIAGAKDFLQRKSLSAYCDAVLIPALRLAHTDFTERAITAAEQLEVNRAISSLFGWLENSSKWWEANSRISVLDAITAGRQLREWRERLIGRPQRPLDSQASAVAMDIAPGSAENEMAAEILVRVLRARNVIARHLSPEDLEAAAHPGATPEVISLVCFVSLEPNREHDRLEALAAEIRQRLPQAKILALCLPSPLEKPEQRYQAVAAADRTAHSFVEGIEIGLGLLQAASKRLASQGAGGDSALRAMPAPAAGTGTGSGAKPGVGAP